MEILLLGGSGDVGRETARILDADPLVSGITIAARNQPAAADFASTLATASKAVVVDATNEDSVAEAAAGHDLIVNAAGPDYLVMMPSLRAAIRARTNYCDVSADGPATEEALAADAEARAAGISALIGIGGAPGVTNLFALHAARQLDEPEEIEIGFTLPAALFIPDPSAMLETIRAGGRVNATLQTVIRWASSTVRTFEGHQLTSVPGFDRSVDVPLLAGGTARAFEIGSSEPVTLPAVLREIGSVRTYMSFLPDPICDVIRTQGRRVSDEGLSTHEAAIALLEAIEEDPERLLAITDDPPPIGMFARVTGLLGGRRSVVVCQPTSVWMTPHGALAVGAKKLLAGELKTPGVLSPESCLDPESFFADILPFAEDPPPGPDLLQVSVEQLD